MKPAKIGIWSEIKLEIVRNYVSAYTKMLSKKNGAKRILKSGKIIICG